MQAIRHGTMLPSLQRNEIGTSELDPFAAQYLARGLPCERFTAALASRTSCITRGRGGWLNLPRGGLPPPILCQLPGALCSGSRASDLDRSEQFRLYLNSRHASGLCFSSLRATCG